MKKNTEEIASEILNCAFRVHSNLGPGLLESAYEACLSYELTKSGLRSLRQVPQPIIYDTLQLDEGYRLDLLSKTTSFSRSKQWKPWRQSTTSN